MPELACLWLGLTLCGWPPQAPHAGATVADALAQTVRVTQEAVPVQITDAWLGSDKFRHFGMSYAVTAFSFAAARGAGLERSAALQVAIPVAAVAGIGKEVSDRRRGEIFSVRDLVADALGIAAAYLLLREVH